MTKTDHQQAIQIFLKNYSTPVQILTSTLRAFLSEHFPSLHEKLYMGWKAIGYTHPQAGYIMAIFLSADKIKIGFEHGASLNDPEHKLVPGPSGGKQVRYYPIDTYDPKVHQILHHFITQAITHRLTGFR